MHIFKFLLAGLVFFSTTVFAVDSRRSPTKAQIDQAVLEFYATQTSIQTLKSLMRFEPKSHKQDCDDEEGEDRIKESCRDVACDLLGSFGCDDLSEIEAVGDACRGNRDGGCLSAACDRLGAFDCDDLSEIQRVARFCRGHFSRRCLNVACDLLGAFDCDDFSEIEAVGEACRGTPSRCLESTCQRLGNFGCDDLSEIVAVANSCRGN